VARASASSVLKTGQSKQARRFASHSMAWLVHIVPVRNQQRWPWRVRYVMQLSRRSGGQFIPPSSRGFAWPPGCGATLQQERGLFQRGAGVTPALFDALHGAGEKPTRRASCV